MKYLVDTNVLSEIRRDRRAAPGVAHWASATDPVDMAISVVTVQEIETGNLLVARHDRAQGAHLQRWLHEKVLPLFAGRVLGIDTRTALRCAALHVPDPRPYADALIAATALVHDLTLVTRNTKHFAGTGVRLLNPWDT